MNKKELLQKLDEIEKYLELIQHKVKNMSAKEIKESNYNNSDITQLLIDLMCMSSELAYDMGME